MALAAPFLAVAAPSAGANVPRAAQPTEVDVTDDVTHRYGEPQLAVNPKNPKNIVYGIMSHRETYACQQAGDPNCIVRGDTRDQPLGFWAVPDWYSTALYVTFNGGKTWKNVDFPAIPKSRGFPLEAADHSNLISRSDPMLTVTADGTFYMGWDAQYLIGAPDVAYGAGGIAVSKSTNGGKTWSTPVLTGTGVDRPWMTTDLSTGQVYEASSGFINGALSTGDPTTPIFGSPPDRYVVSSRNGVKWTTPHGLGSPDFSGQRGATISAAHGVLAAGFIGLGPDACTFFIGTAEEKCVVFETSKDSGATWSRHALPIPAGTQVGEAGPNSILVAADPTSRGTFTVAVLNPTNTAFMVYVTDDSGKTWSEPATITDNPDTVKFKAWINYSPQGALGLAWRSATQPGASSRGPYVIFAATSDDSGVTWSDPLQISTGESPGPDPTFTGGGLDDTSYIALNKNDVFVGWGDWRPGEVQGYFSAVKQQAFKNTGN